MPPRTCVAGSPCRWHRSHPPALPRPPGGESRPAWACLLPGEARLQRVPPLCSFTMFARGQCHRGLTRGGTGEPGGGGRPSRTASGHERVPGTCWGTLGLRAASAKTGGGGTGNTVASPGRDHGFPTTTLTGCTTEETPRDSSAEPPAALPTDPTDTAAVSPARRSGPHHSPPASPQLSSPDP